MKILMLVSSLRSGGAERVASILCNTWAERSDEVMLIATFSGGGAAFYPFDKRVRVIFLADVVQRKWYAPSYFERMQALSRIVAEFAPGVVISFLSNVNVSAVISAVGKGIPTVICERSDPQHRPISRMLRLACNLTYPRANALVVQTDAVREKVGRYLRLPSVVVAIPNPLPQGVVEMVVDRCHSSGPRKTLVSLGRLSEEKQVATMIDAFFTLAGDHPDWDYVVYGDGPQRAELQAQIDRLGLTSRITLAGNTTEPWEWLASADAFLMASRFEGFPNALLEAMGLGLPCVVFDCESGPREITRNGQDALLVPLNDQQALVAALGRVMGDETLRQSLGARARASVLERYETSQVLARWDDVFRAVGALH